MTPSSYPALPGLARERTVLAWNRSGLAAAVCIAVLLRHVWPLRGAVQYVTLALIAVAAMVWALVLLAVSRGAGESARLILGRSVAYFMTAATVILALVGLVLALVAPP